MPCNLEITPRRAVEAFQQDFVESSPNDNALRKVRRARAASSLVRCLSLPEEGEPIASIDSIEMIMKTGGLSQASLDALCVYKCETVQAKACANEDDLNSTIASSGLSQLELDALSSEDSEIMSTNGQSELSGPEDFQYRSKRLRAFAGAVEADTFAIRSCAEASASSTGRPACVIDQAYLDHQCQGADGSDTSGDEAAILRIRRHRAFSGAVAAERFAEQFEEKRKEQPSSRFARAQLELDRLCIDEDENVQDEVYSPVASSPVVSRPRINTHEGDVQVATPHRRCRISMSKEAGSKPTSPSHKFEAASPKAAWSPGLKFEGSPGRGGA